MGVWPSTHRGDVTVHSILSIPSASRAARLPHTAHRQDDVARYDMIATISTDDRARPSFFCVARPGFPTPRTDRQDDAVVARYDCDRHKLLRRSCVTFLLLCGRPGAGWCTHLKPNGVGKCPEEMGRIHTHRIACSTSGIWKKKTAVNLVTTHLVHFSPQESDDYPSRDMYIYHRVPGQRSKRGDGSGRWSVFSVVPVVHWTPFILYPAGSAALNNQSPLAFRGSCALYFSSVDRQQPKRA